MRRPYVTADVFASAPFGGNPLAVVFDATGLSAAQMQSIATEFNYSETTFVLPPRDSAHTAQVRIFTPRQELLFAGHPSVGAAWAALDAGRVSAGSTRLVQECAAGLLPVAIEGDGDTRRPQVRAPRAQRVGAVV